MNVDFLYHGTTSKNLASIKKDGLRDPVYLGNEVVASYYAETVSEEEGGYPIILMIKVSELESSRFAPDMPGIEEPLTYTLKKSEEDIWEEWDASEQTAEDCLRIIGSCLFQGHIEPQCIYLGENMLSEDSTPKSSL